MIVVVDLSLYHFNMYILYDSIFLAKRSPKLF